MLLSTFAPLHSDRASKTYHQRKRNQGKRHNQAAHRRVLTLYTMIHNRALYNPQPSAQLPTTI